MARITFYGAAETVTGSKYLVEAGNARVMVDYGAFQGLKSLRELNWNAPTFDPKAIDSVVLTHAHIDHIGLLPRLVKQGFHGPVYATPPTVELAALMLLDNWAHHNEKASENIHQTFSDVEWITIFFFIGLFVVVHGVEVGGLLTLLGEKLVAATGGNLATTGYAILWASAILSAIVDNIPFVATMIPLIKSMAGAFGGPDKIEPLWWCLSLGACLGGNGTLIGASANLTVAGIGDRNGVPFSFVKFALSAFPLMLVSIAISHVYVWLRYF